MFTGDEISAELCDLGVTHLVWLPDSALGAWEAALASCPSFDLVRICREGEAWAVAAGLFLGGARPLVLIQCTGLFDSGDSLRNAVHDFGLPLFAIIGYRNYLNPAAVDSAKTYTEPTLAAWQIPWRLIDSRDKLHLLRSHYSACCQAGEPGAVLIAEGRM